MGIAVGAVVGAIAVVSLLVRRRTGSRHWPRWVAREDELARSPDHLEDPRLGQVVLARFFGRHTASTRRVENFRFVNGRTRKSVSIDTTVFAAELATHWDAGQHRYWRVLPVYLLTKRSFPGDQKMMRSLDVSDEAGNSLPMLGHYDNAIAAWSALVSLFLGVVKEQEVDSQNRTHSNTTVSDVERELLWRIAAWSRTSASQVARAVQALAAAETPMDGLGQDIDLAILAEFQREEVSRIVEAYYRSRPFRHAVWTFAENFLVIVELPDQREQPISLSGSGHHSEADSAGQSGDDKSHLASYRQIVKIELTDDQSDFSAVVHWLLEAYRGGFSWRHRIWRLVRLSSGIALEKWGILASGLTTTLGSPVGPVSLHVNVESPPNVRIGSLAVATSGAPPQQTVAADNRISRWPGTAHVHVPYASPRAAYTLHARFLDERLSQGFAGLVAAVGLAISLSFLSTNLDHLHDASQLLPVLLIVPAALAGPTLARPQDSLLARLTRPRRVVAGLLVLVALSASASLAGLEVSGASEVGSPNLLAATSRWLELGSRLSALLALYLLATLVIPRVQTWLVRRNHRLLAAGVTSGRGSITQDSTGEPTNQPVKTRPATQAKTSSASGQQSPTSAASESGQSCTESSQRRVSAEELWARAMRAGPLCRLVLALSRRRFQERFDEARGTKHESLWAVRAAVAHGAAEGIRSELEAPLWKDLESHARPAGLLARRGVLLALLNDDRWVLVVHAARHRLPPADLSDPGAASTSARPSPVRPEMSDDSTHLLIALAICHDTYSKVDLPDALPQQLGLAGRLALRQARLAPRAGRVRHLLLHVALRSHVYSPSALRTADRAVSSLDL